ncbi:MAG: DUF308 domain-containing protein, partial [Bryobacteraceae bacterium]
MSIGPLFLILGAVAVIAPLLSAVWGLAIIGLTLVVAGSAEIVHVHRSGARTPAAYRTSIFTLIAGIVVSFENNFVFSGLMAVTALVIGLDGALTVVRTLHRLPKTGRFWGLFDCLTSIALAFLVWILRDQVGPLGFGLLMGIRIAAAGWA